MSRARCTLKVQGLDCPVEMGALQSVLERHPGISRLQFDLTLGTMTVDYKSDIVGPAYLAEHVLNETGMRATVIEDGAIPPSWWARHRRWLLTGSSGLFLLLGVFIDFLGLSIKISHSAYLIAIVLGGVELVPKACRSFARLRFDIHVLMTGAIGGALALRQWDEAATVAFLFGLSESLEALSLERAKHAIQKLLEVAPQMAEIVAADGAVRVVPASQVAKGDHVRVRAGERIPIDGRVLSGRSSVDQKAITGESVPILRETDDPVFAGSINGDGALVVEAAGPVGDSLISRIIQQVREAQSLRAPVERRIGHFASYYTPAAMICALVIMLLPPLYLAWTGFSPGVQTWKIWFGRGLVVLVIACPCALVIATPVAVVSGLAAAARRGILIKGGAYLEEFGQLQALAFDKTGTLTRGEPDVVEVVATGAQPDNQILRIAAALGDRGGHVLGRAIARHARELHLNVPVADDYLARPGLGASGRVDAVEYYIGSHRYIDEAGLCPPDFHISLGSAEQSVGTSVALSTEAGPLGWIRLADQARSEAAGVIKELNELGLETVMLTGDNTLTAAAMARQLGIKEHRGDLLPADKVSAIAELEEQYGPTGMVGDGVNDAPALASARVSVALGGISSGAALETADVVLMADNLNGLPWLIRHSRNTLKRIRQNIGIALATKAVVLILAACGYVGLGLAIASDLGTSLVVIVNALRLLRSPE